MKIEYYYEIPSLFTYLESLKFQPIAKKYKAEIIQKLCELVGEIFAKIRGISVPQRSPQRQKYCLDKVKRWSNFLNTIINIKSKFFPSKNPHFPAKFTIAANLLGTKVVFGHELLKKIPPTKSHGFSTISALHFFTIVWNFSDPRNEKGDARL